MLKTLKIKFIAAIMLVVTITLIVICGLIFYFTKSGLEKESLQTLENITFSAFPPNRPDGFQNEVRLPVFTLAVMPDGELKASGDGYFELSDEDFLHELFDKVYENKERSGVIGEYNLRYVKHHSPMGEFLAFSDISNEKAMLGNLTQSCILISSISFVLFFGISVFLANWAVKPVAKAWEQQKQFIADASHELKTPLTVIITNAEMLDEIEHNKFSSSILKMSERMRRLVEGMLELARADNGTMTLSFVNFDLSEMVEEAILPFEPLFFEKGLTLTSKIEDDVTVYGDKIKLGQVLDILLDNAMKYSQENSEVIVTLKNQGSSAVISVESCGEELSASELESIFERFYRVDKARNDGKSYGLGLPIAKSIIAEHKGKIWAESANGKNTFFVKFSVSDRKLKKADKNYIIKRG